MEPTIQYEVTLPATLSICPDCGGVLVCREIHAMGVRANRMRRVWAHRDSDGHQLPR